MSNVILLSSACPIIRRKRIGATLSYKKKSTTPIKDYQSSWFIGFNELPDPKPNWYDPGAAERVNKVFPDPLSLTVQFYLSFLQGDLQGFHSYLQVVQ